MLSLPFRVRSVIGILLLEEAARHNPRPDIQVFGSDLESARSPSRGKAAIRTPSKTFSTRSGCVDISRARATTIWSDVNSATSRYSRATVFSRTLPSRASTSSLVGTS